MMACLSSVKFSMNGFKKHCFHNKTPGITECVSTRNQACPAIYLFLVFLLPNFLLCAALLCATSTLNCCLQFHIQKSLGPCFSSFLKHAHTSTYCALLINPVHISLYILTVFTFLFLSYLCYVSHMR